MSHSGNATGPRPGTETATEMGTGTPAGLPGAGALRAPGAVLLVSCYELGHQPMGIASPIGFLEAAGFFPSALDLSVQGLDREKVRRARFVGISVPMHTALRLGIIAAERIHSLNPSARLCFYGLYAALNAGLLRSRWPDVLILAGEFEERLAEILEELDAGRAAVEAAGGAAGAGTREPVLRRLRFVPPSRGRLSPLERYAHVERAGERGLAGYVEATRGCLHTCRHCPIPPVYGGRFFAVPREVVLEDVRRLLAMGAVHITFGDPDFLNGPAHSLRIARALHAEFPGLTFDFTAKIEHILKHRDAVAELSRLGCLFVVTAVESLHDQVLRNLEKGHLAADVPQALLLLRDAGIAMRPTFVPFTPWETIRTYGRILDFVEGHDLIDHVDPIQYAIRLLIPPGSGLLTAPGIRPFLGPLDPEAFSYRWEHPDPRMDRLQREVARLVEEAAASGEDGAITFRSVRALHGGMLGVDSRVETGSAIPDPRRERPPRLTEPWFC